MRGAGQLLERLEHDAVLEREALEDRARERRRRGGLRLPGPPAELRDRRGHVGRMQERRIVGIEERPEGVALVAGARPAGSS